MIPRFIILHHSATSRDRTTFAAVNNYHYALGYGGCGYHYFITADGKITQARKDNEVGCHCIADGMNQKSIGICLAGNFMTEYPTPAQLEALRGILSEKARGFNIPLANILGHREVKNSATLCCGDNLVKWLKDYKNTDLNSIQIQLNKIAEIIKALFKKVGI